MLKAALTEIGCLDYYQRVLKTTCYVKREVYDEILRQPDIGVLQIQEKLVEDYYWVTLKGDAEKVAKGYSGFMYGWWSEIIRGNLKIAGVEDAAIEKLLTKFFDVDLYEYILSLIKDGTYPTK